MVAQAKHVPYLLWKAITKRGHDPNLAGPLRFVFDCVLDGSSFGAEHTLWDGSEGKPGCSWFGDRYYTNITICWWSWGPIGGFVMQRAACVRILGRYSEDLTLIAYRSSGGGMA